MRSSLVRADGLALRFDEAMRFTGGSDSDFFSRAVARGAIIRWVDEAVVKEIVPEERLSLRWNLERARRSGANKVYIDEQREGRGAATAAACLRRNCKNRNGISRAAAKSARACIRFQQGSADRLQSAAKTLVGRRHIRRDRRRHTFALQERGGALTGGPRVSSTCKEHWHRRAVETVESSTQSFDRRASSLLHLACE